MFTTFLICTASFFGLTGVILDAVGAHAITATSAWQSAVRMQLIHALLLLSLAGIGNKAGEWWPKLCAMSVVLGLVLFSGSIYLKTLSGLTWVTRVAPMGGLLLMFAWLCLGIGAVTTRLRGP